MKNLIFVLICVLSLSACNSKSGKRVATGLPVVNDHSQSSHGAWLLTHISTPKNGHELINDYHYRKGDSTRYIQTVNGKVTIDLKGLSIEGILKGK